MSSKRCPQNSSRLTDVVRSSASTSRHAWRSFRAADRNCSDDPVATLPGQRNPVVAPQRTHTKSRTPPVVGSLHWHATYLHHSPQSKHPQARKWGPPVERVSGVTFNVPASCRSFVRAVFSQLRTVQQIDRGEWNCSRQKSVGFGLCKHVFAHDLKHMCVQHSLLLFRSSSTIDHLHHTLYDLNHAVRSQCVTRQHWKNRGASPISTTHYVDDWTCLLHFDSGHFL